MTKKTDIRKQVLELEQRQAALLKSAKQADVLADHRERNADLIISDSSDVALVKAQKIVANSLRRNAAQERDSAEKQRQLAEKYAELNQKYLQILDR